MDKREILSVLINWEKQYDALEVIYKDFHAITKCDIASPMWNTIYRLFEKYTDSIEQNITRAPFVFGWLAWYLYDNQRGEKALKAKAGNMKKKIEVKTLKDLAKILHHERKEGMG